MRVRVPILAYHKVSNKPEWGITSVRIRQFESQVRYLSQQNYHALSLESYITGNYKSNRQQPRIIITFDDADESVYHHAFPILKAHGFTATLFVIADFVGKNNSWDANLGGRSSRHLEWEQIKTLAHEGWEIGSHTATHPDLVNLSSDRAETELRQSKQIISQQIDQPVRFLSYPFNRFDHRIIGLARQAGYAGACALSVPEAFRKQHSDFTIPRQGVYLIDTLHRFQQKLSNSRVEQLKQKVISFASRGTIFYKRLRK